MGRPKRLANLSEGHIIRLLVELRRTGCTVKRIAALAGVSEDTVLRAFSVYRRTASPREIASVRWRRARPGALDSVKGQARLHFSERVLDLAELCRLAETNPPITVTSFARIVGLDEEGALLAFYRMRGQLERHGVILEKECQSGEAQGSAVITFDIDAARGFVKREIKAAETVLAMFKDGKGLIGRYRGSGGRA